MTDKVIGRPGTKFSGRLVALPSKSDISRNYDPKDPLGSNPLSKATYIEFPAMPDEIALDRGTEYLVHTNQVMPDGIHQYLKTRPLEIRFSFRLHYADAEYCQEGPLTLLEVAARLHSFVLPINPINNEIAISAVIGQEYTNDIGSQQAKADQAQTVGIDLTSVIGAKNVRAPVTCQLELMHIDHGQPGIVCRGYVREVGVKFLGPWMRGHNAAYNLPTAAEYSFVFVHRPGHSNLYTHQTVTADPSVSQPQAYADTVKNSLYFTRDLVQMAVYQGLNEGMPDVAAAQQPTEQKRQQELEAAEEASLRALIPGDSANRQRAIDRALGRGPVSNIGSPGKPPPYKPIDMLRDTVDTGNPVDVFRGP